MNNNLKREFPMPTTAGFSTSWNMVGDQYKEIEPDICAELLNNDRIFNGETTTFTDANVNPDLIVNTSHSSSDDDIKGKIEGILGCKINNVQIYKEALIHKSMQKKHSCCNERLEFLGDSVINLAVADFAYHHYSDNEGILTKIRTKLVNRYTLSYLAQITNLSELIITSRQINLKVAQNDKILEDAFEAFIGALYKDLGFQIAMNYVIDLMNNTIDFENLMIDNNYKDILLRYAQKKYNKPPEYALENSYGPAHKKMFKVYVVINGERYASGEASTKKQAEQNAARDTLSSFNVNLHGSIKKEIV